MAEELQPISAEEAEAQGATPVQPEVSNDSDIKPISVEELSQLNPEDVTFIPGGINHIKYGNADSLGRTFARNAASGFTVGASELAEQAALHNAQEREAENEEHPIGAFLGQTAGIVASHLTGIGEAEDVGRGAMILNKAVNPVSVFEGIGKVAGKAAEESGLGKFATGAIQGAATVAPMGAVQNAFHESSLGDPNLNAGKIISAAGMGALYGGAGGGLLGGAINKFLPNKLAAEAIKSGIGGSTEDLTNAAKESVLEGHPNTEPLEAEEISPENDFQGSPEHLPLPQQEALVDAIKGVPDLKVKVTPHQIASLENPENIKIYKGARDLPGELGTDIRKTELAQKYDLTNKTDETIKNLAPDSELTSDRVESGERAKELLTNAFKEERIKSGQPFEQMKLAETGHADDHLVGVLDAMSDYTDQNGNKPLVNISKMFGEDGINGEINKFSTKWGIKKNTYNALKDVISDLRDNPETFEELQNIRGGMDNYLSKLDDTSSNSQILSAKAAFLDYLQGVVDKAKTPLIDAEGNQISARDAFKRYAINQQNGEFISKRFGAPINSWAPEKPLEKITGNIFSNTVNVAKAKEILKPEEFKEILANWLSENRAKVTDNKVFSSNKWGSFLAKNRDVLNEAFRDAPDQLKRLKDINTISRILPDAVAGNPSGTGYTVAKAAADALKETFAEPLALLEPKAAGLKALTSVITDQIKEYRAKAAFEGMTERAAKAGILSSISDSIIHAQNKIDSAAKSIFGGYKAFTISGIQAANYTYLNSVKKINELANNQDEIMKTMDHATAFTNQVAPEISQQIKQHMVAGVQFLNTKIPRPLNPQLLDGDHWEPSQAQKLKFLEYYKAVNDPVSVLKQVRNGTLSNESMESLQNVYPQLLQLFRQKVIENLDTRSASSLPHSTKMSLSKFLGQPLSVSLTPKSILTNQISLQMNPRPNDSQANQRAKGSSAKHLDLKSRASTRTQRTDEP